VGGVKDESGGHRQGFGAVGVDVGRIESELELGGTCFRRWPGEDAEAAGDGAPGSETTVKARPFFCA
jgi:hypothetical protein